MIEKQGSICCPKRIVFVMVFVGLLSFPLLSPVCCSNDPHEYYFEDVNVLVIGRCRTIESSGGPWFGGLYKGTLSGAGIQTCDTWLERMHVFVYNNSLFNIYQKFLRLTNHTVGMENATGIFFWGAKGFGVRYIPPVIFVWCHADKLWIHDAEWEPGNLSFEGNERASS